MARPKRLGNCKVHEEETGEIRPLDSEKEAMMKPAPEEYGTQAWTYKGAACLWTGNSFACPAFKLYGFTNYLQLHRAIDRAWAARRQQRIKRILYNIIKGREQNDIFTLDSEREEETK